MVMDTGEHSSSVSELSAEIVNAECKVLGGVLLYENLMGTHLI